MSFTVEFHFEPNNFFKNTVLTKVYKLTPEPEPVDPVSYNGPQMVGCEGCKIDWHKEKDVTMKTIKKKQKHKGRGTMRTITKQVPNDSFFNIFNPIRVSWCCDPVGEDAEFTLAADFEIGHFFRAQIIPRAVLYFTGEVQEDDESFEEEELEEGEEEVGKNPSQQSANRSNSGAISTTTLRPRRQPDQPAERAIATLAKHH